MGYLEILPVFISLFAFLCYSFRNKNGIPTNWPVFGMLPALLKNYSRVYDYIFEVGEKVRLTLFIKGPWFTNMKLLCTADPTNTHHILSQNFTNYPKGSKFKEIFEILGDGIFNVDSEVWIYQRKMTQSFLGRTKFTDILVKKVRDEIKIGLIPILDNAANQRSEIELHDLFRRLTFDTICSMTMDFDPESLCIDLPSLPFFKALHDFEKAVFHRYILPTCIWKFQRWLGVGLEKKYKEAWKAFDDFLYKCIYNKREERRNPQSHAREVEVSSKVGFDLISFYMDDARNSNEIGANDDKFLRDTILAFLFAGQETNSVALSWFFYLLCTNPKVLSKIKEEFNAALAQIQDDHNDEGELLRDPLDILSRKFGELNDKLVYLHAAICETRRLYPPVVFNIKTPIQSETLPSGHQVDPSMQVVICVCGMGRMKSIWGEDCQEFKPERWILETGKIKYEPSYKFLAFNTGPRTCSGKSMSLTVMKIVALAIINKYHIELVQGHPVVPDVSVILRMKHGLKVKVAGN